MRSNTIFILANLFLPILTAPLPVTGVRIIKLDYAVPTS
jgi:hypothetical protein